MLIHLCLLGCKICSESKNGSFSRVRLVKSVIYFECKHLIFTASAPVHTFGMIIYLSVACGEAVGDHWPAVPGVCQEGSALQQLDGRSDGGPAGYVHCPQHWRDPGTTQHHGNNTWTHKHHILSVSYLFVIRTSAKYLLCVIMSGARLIIICQKIWITGYNNHNQTKQFYAVNVV